MIKVIYLALLAGVIIFGSVVIVVTRATMKYDLEFQNPLFIVAAVLTAINISAASVLHRIFFRVGGVPADAETAQQKYQTFVLMRAALIEGAALFSATATMITCNIMPAFPLILCVGALIMYRPSQQEFIDLMSKAAGGKR